LTKVPAGKWLGINVVLWGIATACTAAATNYTTLLVARIFLGIFEAPVVPTLTLVSSQWYTKSEQGPRFAFWYCGLGIGQVIGGLLSFAFQHVTSRTFQSWRMMFVVLGCLTVVLGFTTFFIIPDSPSTARFLTEEEKVVIRQHVAQETTGAVGSGFKPKQLVDALTDSQLLLLCLMTILVRLHGSLTDFVVLTFEQPSISSGVVTTYSATLIRNFGYTPRIAALLNIPSGAVSVASTLAVGYGTRKTSHRWAWFVATCIPGIIGGALMSFLPKSNRAGLLAGIYMVNFIVPTVVITYQFAAANTSGRTKRAFSTTLMAFSFGVGNIIGPQTFRAQDAPQYLPAKITVLVTQSAGAVLAVLLFGYYKWSNSRRKQQQSAARDDDGPLVGDQCDVTDRKNASFRYVY
jgi:MFS family permease